MTIHEFAAMLDGRNIGNEITYKESQQAKALGYVVVYGASDDLCEFDGAIRDEVSCFKGKEIHILDGNIVIPPDCDCKHAQAYYESQKKCAVKLDALWCQEGDSGPAWTYKLHSDRDVAEFNILEDESVYCRGVVFAI